MSVVRYFNPLEDFHCYDKFRHLCSSNKTKVLGITVAAFFVPLPPILSGIAAFRWAVSVYTSSETIEPNVLTPIHTNVPRQLQSILKKGIVDNRANFNKAKDCVSLPANAINYPCESSLSTLETLVQQTQRLFSNISSQWEVIQQNSKKKIDLNTHEGCSQRFSQLKEEWSALDTSLTEALRKTLEAIQEIPKLSQALQKNCLEVADLTTLNTERVSLLLYAVEKFWNLKNQTEEFSAQNAVFSDELIPNFDALKKRESKAISDTQKILREKQASADQASTEAGVKAMAERAQNWAQKLVGSGSEPNE